MNNTKEGNRIRSARYRERHREELRQQQRDRRATPENKAYKAEYHNQKRFGGLRYLVLQRDNYKCQQCDYPWEEGDRYIVVHHVDHNPTNNTMDNLATLCRRCHPLAHGAWTEERKRRHSEILKAANNNGGWNKGIPQTIETRQKIRLAHIGRRHSPETIERMRESKRQWWAAKKAAQ